MAWTVARSYKAIIGGCFFSDVPIIFEIDKQPIITVKTDSENNLFGVDVDIRSKSGELIATVRNSVVEIQKSNECVVHKLPNRQLLINAEDGRGLFDLKSMPPDADYSFELSLHTYLQCGLPVSLHPNRIRIGCAQILRPHAHGVILENGRGGERAAIEIVLPTKDIYEGRILVPFVEFAGANIPAVEAVAPRRFNEHLGSTIRITADNPFFKVNEPLYVRDLGISGFPIAISAIRSDELAVSEANEPETN